MNTESKSMHGWRLRSKRFGALALGVAVTGATLCGTARPAHALTWVEATEIATFFKETFAALNELKDFLGIGSAGPDVAALLAQTEARIITEMRKQRNLELVANAQSAFQQFRMLADNAEGDPTNDDQWSDILTLHSQTAAQIQGIILQGDDVESAYVLAPAYTALIASGTALLRFKQEIFPGFFSSWSDYYTWLQPAMATNYKLVGAHWHECWPGHNPGFAPEPPLSSPQHATWVARMKPGKSSSSLLWTKKLANKYFHVATYSVKHACRESVVTLDQKWLCNPVSKKCKWDAAYPVGCFDTSTLTWNRCSSVLTHLECANFPAIDAFMNDPVAELSRQQMLSVQTLSGGNDFDAPNNNIYMFNGKFVDPWVSEPSCGESPWAYPHAP